PTSLPGSPKTRERLHHLCHPARDLLGMSPAPISPPCLLRRRHNWEPVRQAPAAYSPKPVLPVSGIRFPCRGLNSSNPAPRPISRTSSRFHASLSRLRPLLPLTFANLEWVERVPRLASA